MYALLSLLLLPLAALAHQHHDEQPSDKPLTWAETHLRSEHHIYNYDAGAFFSLHDFDASGRLSQSELLRTYEAPPERADEIWMTLKKLIVPNNVGTDAITRQEWMEWSARGGVLPDLGTGVGHHGDAEYEYEIHHFEKFHQDSDGDDEMIHPEDIEHFKHHDEEDAEEARQALLEKMAVNVANIPMKFRVQGK
ncbi:secretory pathway protein Ssp120 [Geopyxis carbonaria]|nr:secretory pathway protein Ssp120 [Geopyxis carbonaria]